MSAVARTAFVLCAGWGERLRPLTDQIPKPLVPICGVPLCEFALARLVAAGVERIVINTHRLPGEFKRLFPEYPGPSNYAGVPVFFRHEPELLETAGGLKNVDDLLLPGPVVVHNGDILTTIDLGALLAAHGAGGAWCTLALRSDGGPRNVGFDAARGVVTDFRGVLASPAPCFLYTGVCVVEADRVARLPAGRPVSFVEVWLEALRAGEKIAGVVLDEGVWRDIGTVPEYLRIHADLAAGTVRLKAPASAPAGWPRWTMPGAQVADGVELRGWNWLGSGCVVEAGSTLRDSVVWTGGRVEAGSIVEESVIREGMLATGDVRGAVV